jgi:hypothetical protein
MNEDAPGGSQEEKLPWDTDPVQGWRATVEGWEWRSTGAGGWEKAGPCLRCEHGITIEKASGSFMLTVESVDAIEELLVTAEEGPFTISANDDSEKFFARCNCTGEHPGRPPRITRGCGQWAEIDPPPDNG